MIHSEKTLVGIPFYEKEGQDCLDITLHNIDDCLNNLGIEASIVVYVNGPETSQGHPPNFIVNQSLYNFPVIIINSRKIGQILAVDDLMDEAISRGVDRAFITDADIYRFPDSLKKMWQQKGSVVIGARYRPYPLDVVEAAFGPLTHYERLLYQVFDGDQSPQVREILKRHGVDRTGWVKGSLMLLDVIAAKGMHDNQNIVSDSVINRKIKTKALCIADDAFFMHMGRIDMTDHIQARMRHFRAAAVRGELDCFLNKEVSLPDEDVINLVADEIRRTVPRGDYYAMLYLARCAVRSKVNEICLGIVLGNWDEAKLIEPTSITLDTVATYADANRAINRFFVGVDWPAVRGFAIGAPATTQERLRVPFNLDLYLSKKHLADVVYSSLGVIDSSHKDYKEILLNFPKFDMGTIESVFCNVSTNAISE